MFKNISIIGDGGMGTVLAMLLCGKREALSAKREASDERPVTSHEVRMWGYDRRQLEEIEQGRENKKFLPGYKLPEQLVFEADDERITAGADLIVSAVPCQFMRGVWKRLKDYVSQDVPIVSVAKGIENDTLLRPTQILGEILDEKRGTRDEGRETRFAVLSGPTIADELARRLPATACAAAEDEALAKEIQHTFSDGVPWLRVYTNTDIVGVELAGAMKNIIAIAAGIIDGTGAGDNAKAALLTRGLAEITRLGVTMGAKEQTFAGLTGLGDLVTTCISPKGRNRSFGERVGKGQTAEQAQRATESVVEGVATCKSVVALGEQYNVEMPITQAVYEVLFENKPVHTAIEDLMKRQLKSE
ncbi:MAG TPA: NAD(P)H-dependent glycerol-3-phosphate dehydrogenase [Sedimentisphaerales bacterium]|nr:NAD(P)H-dependent glycerol-3-phosphate dehydrogenase [Sedimentisphaerales bacterium]